MIILRSLSLSFGEQDVFKEISATFADDQKIGIVGRNGAGKSTLLKAIAGLQKLDDGSISCERGKTIAYLPQEITFTSTKSVYDEAFMQFSEFTELEAESHDIMHQLEQGASNATQLIDRYNTIQQKLAFFDRPSAEQRTREILTGLGFSAERQAQTVDTLSVGWKMRIILAKLLLQNADFYLFDEPTNHLDLPTKEWFMEFLQHASFGFLLITHDRHFLESACQSIFELERGHGTMYYGNFSFYVAQKEQAREQQQTAYERQQKEIAHKTDIVNKFKAGTRSMQARSISKQLERMELVEPPESPLPSIKITFPPVAQAGKVVLTIEDVSHSFGDTVLFSHATCDIPRGKKFALVAPNGTGKTTLFNLIVGKLPLQHGKITFGYNVQPAFFEQDQTQALNLKRTIIEEINEACPKVPESTTRRFLGTFLFSGDDIHKKIGVLSGGEKNRVAMVKVLLQNANFLLLDEPTNHLDLYAKEVLLQALQQFQGTILFVSHDHNFIQELATDILELTPKGLYHYPGKYEDFLADRAEEMAHAEMKAAQAELSSGAKHDDSEEDNKGNNAARKKIRSLESTIAKLEAEQEKLYVAFTTHTYGSPEYTKADNRLTEVQKQLGQATAEWEELQKVS